VVYIKFVCQSYPRQTNENYKQPHSEHPDMQTGLNSSGMNEKDHGLHS
jgi:hypothetical protein